MKLVKCFFIIAAVFSLAACSAGVDFVKPSDGKIIIGKSTKAQVISVMGEPNGKGSKIANGEDVESITYAYASVTGDAIFEGVTPARAMSFLFNNDLLVGEEFTSSFKSDSTYFNKDLVKSIKEGMSKKEVLAVMGAPGGEFRYPMISDKSGSAMVYSFTQTRGFKSQITTCVIELDQSGVVVKTDFQQVGQF